jgi:hypothetical protein
MNPVGAFFLGMGTTIVVEWVVYLAVKPTIPRRVNALIVEQIATLPEPLPLVVRPVYNTQLAPIVARAVREALP